jgi:hypothetical protein
MPPGIALWLHVFGFEVGEDLASLPRPCDKDVEATFASVLVQRTEALREVSLLVLTVADADEDDIALVALDVLEVLHVDGLGGMLRLVGRE